LRARSETADRCSSCTLVQATSTSTKEIFDKNAVVPHICTVLADVGVSSSVASARARLQLCGSIWLFLPYPQGTSRIHSFSTTGLHIRLSRRGFRVHSAQHPGQTFPRGTYQACGERHLALARAAATDIRRCSFWELVVRFPGRQSRIRQSASGTCHARAHTAGMPLGRACCRLRYGGRNKGRPGMRVRFDAGAHACPQITFALRPRGLGGSQAARCFHP
jgi:hypothetical protein